MIQTWAKECGILLAMDGMIENRVALDD